MIVLPATRNMVGRKCLRLLERGKRNPSRVSIYRLTVVLGVEMKVLFG